MATVRWAKKSPAVAGNNIASMAVQRTATKKPPAAADMGMDLMTTTTRSITTRKPPAAADIVMHPMTMTTQDIITKKTAVTAGTSTAISRGIPRFH